MPGRGEYSTKCNLLPLIKKTGRNFKIVNSFYSFASLYKRHKMKDRIQQKARELFLRYGFRSVKMDDISKELGISKKTVYQYFSDKDSLVDEVMNCEIEKIRTCLSVENMAENAIDALLRSMQTFENQMDAMNPDILIELEKFYPVTYKKFKRFKTDFFLAAIKQNIVRGIEEGLYRPEIDADITSKLRLESAFFIFNQEHFPYGKYNLMRVAKETLMFFIHGLVSAKGKIQLEKYLQKQLSELEKSAR